MDAKAKPVSEILHSGDQFLVPFFQRSYSWHKKHWKRLWSDLRALLDDPGRKQHFLGPLVCASLKSQPGEIHSFQLIDGQQRLTTLSLLLAAVRDATRKLGDEELAAEISETYLINRFKKGSDRYKVVPRLGDRETFISLAEGKPLGEGAAEGLREGHEFFTKSIQSDGLGDIDKLRVLADTIVGRLHLVVITLDEENPYEIFESLNSTGLPLEESDLIRNFLFMQMPLEEHADFQQEHWQKYEELFEAEGDFPELPATRFYRDFLMRNGTYSRAGATFVDFKDYYAANYASAAEAVEELTRFVHLARAIARRGSGQPTAIARAIRQFEMLDATTARPLLLHLLDRHERRSISDSELTGILQDLTSFIIRRSFCGETTRAYNRWFCEAIGALGDAPREGLQKYLAHRGWPDDDAFVRSAVTFPAYRRELKKVRLILEGLEESFGHKEKVDLSPLQVEHVMPQKLPRGPKGTQWKEMLGEKWSRLHRRALHTLGNLTLTGYNPNLSNKPFLEKRDELVKSKLSINDFFKQQRVWNYQTITTRTKQLAQQAAELWPRPAGIGEYKPVRPAREHVPKAGRERRLAYWTKLIEVLESQSSPWLPVVPVTGAILHLDLPTHDAYLTVRYQMAKKRFEIRLRFKRTRGKRMFELLKQDQADIDSAFQVAPQWGTPRVPAITMSRDGSTMKDPLNWYDQHQWIAARLNEFHAAFFDRLQSLDDKVQEPDPRRRRLLKYWTQFYQLVRDKKSPILPHRPLPQRWITFSLGRSWFGVSAYCSTQASKITVGAHIAGPLADQHFQELKKSKRDIEAEVGEELVWRADTGKVQRHIEISQDNVDLIDEDRWRDQHEWLLDKAIRLHAALHQRVKDLPTSYE